jgi:hypothetical protein
MGYPVVFDVGSRPERYDRAQAVLRLLLLIAFSFAGSLFGWLFGVVYLLVPLLAAILVSQAGGGYLSKDGERATRWLRWLVAAYAYLLFLTDRFPSGAAEDDIRFEVRTGGEPTVGSALTRLVTSLPSAVVLALLGLVAAIAWVIELVTVLVWEGVPRSLFGFQQEIVRWLARLLAYHASLIEEYPPFSLDTGPEPHAEQPVDNY